MSKGSHRKLGVNIDHVATLRQARLTDYPCPLRAARQCTAAGADLITLHLREDARHIQIGDLRRLCEQGFCRINLELAASEPMIAIAHDCRPDDCCLVPEKRQELTTEGGLDVAGLADSLHQPVRGLIDAGIRLSAFIEPDRRQIEAAAELGLGVVELHTGSYANATDKAPELARLADASAFGRELGLQINAGHGLTLDNIAPVAEILALAEFNIGHFIVSEALFVGFDSIVSQFKQAIMRPFNANPDSI